MVLPLIFIYVIFCEQLFGFCYILYIVPCQLTTGARGRSPREAGRGARRRPALSPFPFGEGGRGLGRDNVIKRNNV